MAGSWLTLSLNRRWRPEPTWLDRLGRALGLYWIACGGMLAFHIAVDMAHGFS